MAFRRLLALILLALPASAPAIVIRHDVPDSRYRVDEAGFPFLFALYRTRAGHRDCIATLIAPQWAITAAHCTEDQPFVRALAAPTPAYRVEIGGRDAFIDRVVRYPSPEGAPRVDIALLHFSAPVTHVSPIAVYPDDDELGRVVLLPGWGGFGNGAEGLKAPDGLFRIAENRIDAVHDGRLFWAFDDPRSALGRALPLEGISGPGDSGGPALIMTGHGWAIAGVSFGQRTFGRAEGVYGNEEVYVRLFDRFGWIAQVTGTH
ncbi:S1 family peptidase [Allosphingosinicella sp.]|uniref:S1 family peptidase n=1 Tax=Allosphingosinicella sp. TaxID=2823234 RepID=UPI0037841C96